MQKALTTTKNRAGPASPPEELHVKQLELPHTQGGPGGSGEYPTQGPPDYVLKCLRQSNAYGWIHAGWQADARTVAVMCLRTTPSCKLCRDMLDNMNRR